MKKCLISPNESCNYISKWTETGSPKSYVPVFSNIGQRIAEVSESEFEVALPMFWIDCADDITVESYYYDQEDETIKPLVNAPFPLDEM